MPPLRQPPGAGAFFGERACLTPPLPCPAPGTITACCSSATRTWPPPHPVSGWMITAGRFWTKLAFCLELASQHTYLPIILGDLFHLPRNNPNHLLVDVMELFRPVRPWVLVGNHDKHEARLTRDVSLAVLQAAGVIKLLAEAGPVGVVASAAGGFSSAPARIGLRSPPGWTARRWILSSG